MAACKTASQLMGDRLERPKMLLQCLDIAAGSGKMIHSFQNTRGSPHKQP